jgi:hypothetical protein
MMLPLATAAEYSFSIQKDGNTVTYVKTTIVRCSLLVCSRYVPYLSCLVDEPGRIHYRHS